jgi:hypothetical protein
MISLANLQGTWASAISRNKYKVENPGLFQQKQNKNCKHAEFYAPIGFAFFAFDVSRQIPAWDHLDLLQFVVFSLWLIMKRSNTSPFLLARVFH